MVRRFFDAVNEQWAIAFSPGYILTIDESMFKFLKRMRMAGWMMVGRKPDSIGHELKTLCCAVSKIIIKMELQEGKTYDRGKKYCAEFGHTVALTLRMMESYRGGPGYVLIGDSWFGSVRCCLVLLAWGIYSILNVKTNKTYFPKARLYAALEDVEYGGHVSYPTSVSMHGKQKQIFAVGHKGPGMMNNKQRGRVGWAQDVKGVPKLLVCSASTTTPSEQGRTYCSKVPSETHPGVLILTTKTCPSIDCHELWQRYFNRIDLINRQRTGTIAMHDVWRTTSFEDRDYGEILGMIHVNAENTWTYFDSDGIAVLADQKAGKNVRSGPLLACILDCIIK